MSICFLIALVVVWYQECLLKRASVVCQGCKQLPLGLALIIQSRHDMQSRSGRGTNNSYHCPYPTIPLSVLAALMYCMWSLDLAFIGHLGPSLALLFMVRSLLP